MKRIIPLAVAAAGALAPAIAVADAVDGNIVISRGDDAIEVYISMAGGDLAGFAGTDTAFLTRGDGTVDLSRFQSDTAVLGDALFTNVQFRVAGTVTEGEAISLMMHEKDYVVPFGTPWDALTAVTLCSVVPDDPFPAIADTTSYVGYSIYPVDGTADFEIALPGTGRDEMTFDILTYQNGEFVSQTTQRVDDGDALRFNALEQGSPIIIGSSTLAMVMILAGIGFFFLGQAFLRGRAKYGLTS